MSTRYNTGNPIESTDVRDMSDNAKNLDLFSNSSELSFADRLGVERKTIHGMNSEFDGMIVGMNSEFDGMIVGMNSEFDAQILNMGFTRVGTFLSGATLTNPRQTLLWDIADGGDGQEYGWTGAFPKTVPANSTPASTGGIAAGAWVSRFDPVTRAQLREAMRRSYAEAGYNLVAGSFEAGGTLVNANDVLLQERTGKAFTGPAGTVAAGTVPSGPNYTNRGDETLRSALADPDKGAAMVASVPITAGSLVDLLNVPFIDGRTYQNNGFYPDTVAGGGWWKAVSNADLTQNNGGTFVSKAALQAWHDAAILAGGVTTANLQANLSALFATGTGTGNAFVLIKSDFLDIACFGATTGYDLLGSVNQSKIATLKKIIPTGNYTSSKLSFSHSYWLEGGGRDVINASRNTRILFSSDGISLSDGVAYTQGVVIKDLALAGRNVGTGFYMNGTISNPCVENIVDNVLIQNFQTGLRSTYAWSNSFRNIRVHNCANSFDISSQSNNTTFSQASFTSATGTSRFINAEGIYFDSMDFSNQSADVAMTLYQSYVVIDNPYFENISGKIQIGSAGEAHPSTLILNGGIISGGFAIGGNGANLELNGCRLSPTESTITSSDGIVPTRYCNLKANVVKALGGQAKINFRGWHLYQLGNTRWQPAGAFGGSIRFFRTFRDCCEIQQDAAANGITVASNLEVGEQYCLVVALQRSDDTATIIVRTAGLSLGFPAAPQVSDGDGFVVRYLPFVAGGTKLDLIYTGTLLVKGVAIAKGIPENVEFNFSNQWFTNTFSSISGSWVAGDYVENTGATVQGTAGSQYIVKGWKRITTGSGNVLNTDWVEDRALTGT